MAGDIVSAFFVGIVASRCVGCGACSVWLWPQRYSPMRKKRTRAHHKAIQPVVDAPPPERTVSDTTMKVRECRRRRFLGTSVDLAPATQTNSGSFRILSGFRVCITDWPLDQDKASIEKVQQALLDDSINQNLSDQQALRIVLATNLCITEALSKWRMVREWRAENSLAIERDLLFDVDSSRPAIFPNHDVICDRIVVASPCALVTIEGYPVNYWYIGAKHESKSNSVPADDVRSWSRSVFEYINAWVANESAETGHLVGYVHIFDVKQLSWSHLMSSDFTEKARLLLGASKYSVGTMYQSYVINAPPMFGMVWKLAKNCLSERAASKVSVDSGHSELCKALGAESVAKLQELMTAANSGVSLPAMRPPHQVLRPHR